MPDSSPEPQPPRPKRRVRYSGRNPRHFEQKYKEYDPVRYAETVQKVLASGKTPAGTHRPIMVAEILEALAPQPGHNAVDCTLGFGGHAEQLLQRLLPDGCLIGLDADPVELPKTEARLRAFGFTDKNFIARRSNFAGLPKILVDSGWNGVDLILADLGVSSMQLDDPRRGFSLKADGPLDMRMNPAKGQSASDFLAKVSADSLAAILRENADEPHAAILAPALAGKRFLTTRDLAAAVQMALKGSSGEKRDLSLRLVFQAVRIAVNDEFSALETFLRQLPMCLNPGGRVAILTFHSGEDRRVKKAFAAGSAAGIYDTISHDIIRPGPEERRDNPRSISAKLRWARRGAPQDMVQKG